MSFNGKVVLVTGASSGIGASIALQFAEQEAKVAIVGRNESKLKSVSEKCEKIGSKPLVIVADLAKDNDAKRVVSETLDHYGKLDVLINNAGIVRYTSILTENVIQVFDEVIATNLRSVVYITNLAAPHLINTKGNIINISSVAAMGITVNDSFAYAASKAALDHFTRCVALELAPKGIRVNTVNPGPVRTDIMQNSIGVDKAAEDMIWNAAAKLTPLGRISIPEDIGDVVLFLTSEKAKSITGASYVADNGTLLYGLIEPEKILNQQAKHIEM